MFVWRGPSETVLSPLWSSCNVESCAESTAHRVSLSLSKEKQHKHNHINDNDNTHKQII